MTNLFISTRNKEGDKFGGEPGPTRYLVVPANAKEPLPSHQKTKSEWRKLALAASDSGGADCPEGDALVFVHGYNSGPADVQKRHNMLRRKLQAHGYRGSLISFDWPAEENVLNYLEDRTDAKATALQLVTGGIELFTRMMQEDCRINVHVLAHSMGAYVVREAFDDADDRAAIASINWTVSQVCLISADVSAVSFAAGNPKTSSLVRHTVRITSYSNPFDNVLKLSDAKRIGLAPRAGRVGLPSDRSPKAVDVDCGPYWDAEHGNNGGDTHSWHFDDDKFVQDLVFTLRGDIDRNSIPTREQVGGKLRLKTS